jgi:hypothetical protein
MQESRFKQQNLTFGREVCKAGINFRRAAQESEADSATAAGLFRFASQSRWWARSERSRRGHHVSILLHTTRHTSLANTFFYTLYCRRLYNEGYYTMTTGIHILAKYHGRL